MSCVTLPNSGTFTVPVTLLMSHSNAHTILPRSIAVGEFHVFVVSVRFTCSTIFHVTGLAAIAPAATTETSSPARATRRMFIDIWPQSNRDLITSKQHPTAPAIEAAPLYHADH